jgi:hypothetical protein
MPLNPRNIINTANSFFLAADRAFEPRPLNAHQVEVLIVPAVVCQAFAIELYLKAILVIEGQEGRGHDLNTLFSQLTEQSRAQIRGKLMNPSLMPD